MLRKWTEFVIGIILIISPWILGFSDISVAKWCNVLIGLALALISVWEIFGGVALAPAMLAEPEPKKKRESKNSVEK
jgi:SPW repeat-containing protein